MPTRFVRPDASHGGNNSGDSYANAYQGWAAMVAANAIIPGDIIYVCGAHTAAGNLTITNHGATNEAGRVVYRGDWPGDPGSVTFTSAGFINANRSWTTYRNLTINNVAGSPSFFVSGNVNSVEILNNRMIGGTLGVSISAASVLAGTTKINGNTISGCALSAVRFAPTSISSTFGPIEVCDNVISNIGVGQSSDGEGIRLTIESAAWTTSRFTTVRTNGNIIRNTRAHAIWCRSGNGDLTTTPAVYSDRCEQNFNDIRNCGSPAGSTGAHGSLSVHGFTYAEAWNNTIWDVFVTGAGVQTAKNVYMLVARNDIRRVRSGSPTSQFQNGFPIDGNGIFFDNLALGGLAWGNYIEDLVNTGNTNSGTGLAFWTAQNCIFRGNVVVNAFRGASYGSTSETGNRIINNTFINCERMIDKVGVNSPAGTLDVRNNVGINCPGGFFSGANPRIVEDWNVLYGAATAYSGVTPGANSQSLPLSAALVDARGRPLPGSILLAGGADLGHVRDFRGVQGRRFVGAHSSARFRNAA